MGLWVLKSFAVLSADNRGDMYHIPGATSFEPRPLIVHTYDEKDEGQKDLVDYLEKTAADSLVTPWTNN